MGFGRRDFRCNCRLFADHHYRTGCGKNHLSGNRYGRRFHAE
uniref:Uncharacterized protein n=1 Tax=Myoviridae sp. ctshb19 TaxID=2825194 RepID=A0A8S5UH12_9CAUD|nr:MAG TPA: hypothetical protein [Myoviridae sp. ctshb19]